MDEEQLIFLIDFYLDNDPQDKGSDLLKYSEDLRMLLEELLSFIEGDNIRAKEGVRYHIIKRAVESKTITVAERTADALLDGEPFVPPATPSIIKPTEGLTERQREYLHVLNETNWSRSKTAKRLGVREPSVSCMIRQCWPEKLLRRGAQPK